MILLGDRDRAGALRGCRLLQGIRDDELRRGICSFIRHAGAGLSLQPDAASGLCDRVVAPGRRRCPGLGDARHAGGGRVPVDGPLGDDAGSLGGLWNGLRRRGRISSPLSAAICPPVPSWCWRRRPFSRWRCFSVRATASLRAGGGSARDRPAFPGRTRSRRSIMCWKTRTLRPTR